MPNPIVYFEITGKDKAVLEDFYRAVFDWQLTPAGDNYSHVIPGERNQRRHWPRDGRQPRAMSLFMWRLQASRRRSLWSKAVAGRG